MSYWGEYGSYNDFRFLRDAEADKKRDSFIKSKMMKRNRKLKGNKRGK